MNKSLSERMNDLFNQIFNLNFLDRTPVTISTNGNSITILDSDTHGSVLLNKPTSGSVRSLKNNIKNKKSAIQRTLFGLVGASKMVENKTQATQMFSLYLNNALVELTNTLGTDTVTDEKNKLIVEFHDVQDHAAIEMRVILKVENKE